MYYSSTVHTHSDAHETISSLACSTSFALHVRMCGDRHCLKPNSVVVIIAITRQFVVFLLFAIFFLPLSFAFCLSRTQSSAQYSRNYVKCMLPLRVRHSKHSHSPTILTHIFVSVVCCLVFSLRMYDDRDAHPLTPVSAQTHNAQ